MQRCACALRGAAALCGGLLALALAEPAARPGSKASEGRAGLLEGLSFHLRSPAVSFLPVVCLHLSSTPSRTPSPAFTERLQLKQKWQFRFCADISVAVEALTIDRKPWLSYLLCAGWKREICRNPTTSPCSPDSLSSPRPLRPQPSPPGSSEG